MRLFRGANVSAICKKIPFCRVSNRVENGFENALVKNDAGLTLLSHNFSYFLVADVTQYSHRFLTSLYILIQTQNDLPG